MHIASKTTTAGAVLAALILAACGSSGVESDKSAQTILNDVVAATKAAKDAHIKGSASGTSLDGDVGGGNYNGSITSSGMTFDIVVVADSSGDPLKAKVFMKASADVWNAQSPSVGTCFADKWIEVDSDANPGLGDNASATSLANAAQQISGGAASFTNFGKLADGLSASAGTPTKGSVQNINGQDAVELKGGDGSLFAANTGTPYMLRVTSSSGQIDFTNWNKGVSFGPPDGAATLISLIACVAQGLGASASPTPT